MIKIYVWIILLLAMLIFMYINFLEKRSLVTKNYSHESVSSKSLPNISKVAPNIYSKEHVIKAVQKLNKNTNKVVIKATKEVVNSNNQDKTMKMMQKVVNKLDGKASEVITKTSKKVASKESQERMNQITNKALDILDKKIDQAIEQSN